MLASIDGIDQVIDDKTLIDDFILCSIDATANLNVILNALMLVKDVRSVELYYLTSEGYPLPVGETFIAAFDKYVSMDVIEEINKKHRSNIFEVFI